ncbi:MAG: MiaB/RimO family radical SAM methylthiotransferase [Endomicrobium sp.]|jgi:threonylcarbamoyladenosine tRNA methylthiotransferase MtaB|nr:MiaB/RimO family radical SAM methylthiotransferase [Endomicrobium sp.]
MTKFYIYTFGCKVNQYESQLIYEKYKKDNFVHVGTPEEADIIIFNSCTVTKQADKECQYFLRKTSKLPNNPKIILTGCLAKNKHDDIKQNLKNESIIIVQDKTTLFPEPTKQTITSFDKRSRAFLKIQDGCDCFCSYCIVPYVRNILWSKPENETISEITNLVTNGYNEIVLTGIHVGKYNGGCSNLLNKIIKIPLEFRVRISSIEINEIDNKLIELMQNYPEKICHHLHIPLQSGNDDILKYMNRKYLTKTFEEKIKHITNILPDLALTTDIITGFPGENQEHHKETCNFIKQNPFSRLHVFRYSDRSGTKASSLINKVPQNIIKSQAKDLFEIDLEKRKEFINKNIGKKRKTVKIGENKVLTDNYITIITDTTKINKKFFEVIVPENAEI